MDIELMLMARISVQPVDQGWAVRVGPDVLVMFPTKEEAISDADLRAAAIRSQGGVASVTEEPAAAIEAEEWI